MCHPFVDGQLGCFHLLKKMFLFNEFFFFFWLHWIFVAAHRLSLVLVSGGYSPGAVSGLLMAVASFVEHGL